MFEYFRITSLNTNDFDQLLWLFRNKRFFPEPSSTPSLPPEPNSSFDYRELVKLVSIDFNSRSIFVRTRQRYTLNNFSVNVIPTTDWTARYKMSGAPTIAAVNIDYDPNIKKTAIPTFENFQYLKRSINEAPAVIGQLFTTSYSSNNYTESDSVTIEYRSSSLRFYGASSPSGRNLKYNSWVEDSENFVFESLWTIGPVGAGNYGFGITMTSLVGSGTDFGITIGTEVGGDYNNNAVVNASVPLSGAGTMSQSISAGNIVRVRFAFVGNVMNVEVRNMTKGVSINLSYTFPLDPPVTRFKALWDIGFTFYGGDLEMSWGISTTDYTQCDLLMMGDSKFVGLFAGGNAIGPRASDLWQAANPSKRIYNNSGGNEQTSHWILKLPEIIKYKPKRVLILAPSNNARTGVLTAQTQADLLLIYNTLTEQGIECWYQNPFLETGGVNQSGLITAGAAVFPANRIIPSPWTAPQAATYVDASDGVHPNNIAQNVIYLNQASYITL